MVSYVNFEHTAESFVNEHFTTHFHFELWRPFQVRFFYFSFPTPNNFLFFFYRIILYAQQLIDYLAVFWHLAPCCLGNVYGRLRGIGDRLDGGGNNNVWNVGELLPD